MSESGGLSQFFRNGKLLAEQKSNIDDFAVHGRWMIGGEDYRGGRHFFAGDIDDVRIYSQALSDEEVAALYVAMSGKPSPQTASGASQPDLGDVSRDPPETDPSQDVDPPNEFDPRQLSVWEIYSGNETLRVVFQPDGKTNKGHQWTIDGNKFSFGYDSGGNLIDGGLHASGRWRRGATFTARLLMKGFELATAETPDAEIPAEHGATAFGSAARGTLDEVMPDAWELTGLTDDGAGLLRLSVNFLPDGRIVDGPRKVGDWKADGRNLLVTFVDDRLGEVMFVPRSANHLVGTTKSPAKFSFNLNRVQQVAVLETGEGLRTLYSNGRVNATRGEGGKGYRWKLSGSRGEKLSFGDYGVTLSDSRRKFSGRGAYGKQISGSVISGSLRP